MTLTNVGMTPRKLCSNCKRRHNRACRRSKMGRCRHSPILLLFLMPAYPLKTTNWLHLAGGLGSLEKDRRLILVLPRLPSPSRHPRQTASSYHSHSSSAWTSKRTQLYWTSRAHLFHRHRYYRNLPLRRTTPTMYISPRHHYQTRQRSSTSLPHTRVHPSPLQDPRPFRRHGRLGRRTMCWIPPCF
jgi:hypothetical protein